MKIITLLVLLFSISIFAKTDAEIVTYSDLIKKKGISYKKGSKLPFTGVTKDIGTYGTQVTPYKKGKKEGLSIHYFITSKKGKKVFYKKGKKTYSYYRHGNIAGKVFYKNGKKEGKSFGWRLMLLERYEVFYRNDKKEGLEKSWHNNIYTETLYKNDKREGKEKSWYKNGKLKYEVNYKNDKKQGLEKSWYKSGKLKHEVKYVDDMKEGVEILWNEDGSKKEKYYENGMEN